MPPELQCFTTDITSVDSGVTPENLPAYNINWTITQFCNLDCSYCMSHNNSIPHPSKDECISAVKFAFEYADLVMSLKKRSERSVVLNLLGGETLTHPHIVDILKYTKELYESTYKDRWQLTIFLMTNAAVGKNILRKCLPYIDRWTVSYHTESDKKQKKVIVDNILDMHSKGKLSSVRVMMHADLEKFNECQRVIDILKENNINFAAVPIGIHQTKDFDKTVHEYSYEQSQNIVKFWDTKQRKFKVTEGNKFKATTSGYPCCSEQLLSVNMDRVNLVKSLPRADFKDWYCGVNLNFLAIRHFNNQIYYNHSCQVNDKSEVKPIGTLDQTKEILTAFKNQIENKCVPIIKCPKDICGCGRCAPKAKDLNEFEQIMSLHVDTSMLDFKNTNDACANR